MDRGPGSGITEAAGDPVGSFVWRPRGDVVSWSDGLYRILGINPDTTPSIEGFFRAVHPDDQARYVRANAQHIPGAQRIRVVRGAKDVRILDIDRTVVNHDGELVVMGVVVDVTDRVAALQRARETENLLLQAQAASKMGTFRWNAIDDTGEWSPEMYRILDYEPGTVAPGSQAFFARVHPADRLMFMESMTRVRQKPQRPPPVRGRLLCGDRVKHVVISGAIHRDENVETWLGTVIDVTDRVALEQRLLLAQKMEAIGTLAGGLAHDFNNYLSVVVANLPVLREGLPHNAIASECLTDIARASDGCRLLTQRLLAFARRQSTAPRAVNVVDLVFSLRGMIDRLVGDHIAVKTETSAADHWVWADPAQLEQVLVNLAVNARDAMKSGGTLSLSVEMIHVDVARAALHPPLSEGDHVMLSVADSGSGIPADIQARVFDPFFTTKEAGTGLGLSTVHGVVEQHAGAVSLTSSESGTTAVVLLPRRQPEVRSEPAPSTESRHPRGSEVILLVEDQREVRRAMKRVLAHHGYSVVVAENAEVALDMWDAQQGTIDLVLSDVQLPGASGIDLVRSLQLRSTKLAAVLMTGYAPEEVLRDVNADMVVLKKPVPVDMLLRSLRRALKSSAPKPFSKE